MDRRAWGIACFFLAACLIAISSYFSYRSGCVFDGKSGLGDAAAAEAFDQPMLMALGAAGLVFSLGVVLVPRRFSWITLLIGPLAFLIFIVPATALLFFMAPACEPGTSGFALVSPNNSSKPTPLRGAA